MSVTTMTMDEGLMYVPTRPVPARPPKRDSSATPVPFGPAVASPVPFGPAVASPAGSIMVPSQTDPSQEAAPSSNSSESGEQQQRPRRGSLSRILTRTKSHEVPVIRSASGRRMLRSKKVRDQEERLRQEQALRDLTRSPPKLPSPASLPQLAPFGVRPDSVAIVSGKAHDYSPQKTHDYSPQKAHEHSSPANFSRPKQHAMNFSAPNPYGVPLPPMPTSLPRTESIVSRGRNSYAPSISASMHSPRRMRRRKDPEAFNILVAGAKSSGKTSFVEFLKTSLALPVHKQSRAHSPHAAQVPSDSLFTPSYIESDMDGERIGITLWDSAGLEKSLVDLQLRDLTAFIESKFEETFNQESRVVRTPGAKDSHIHCVLLILDPARLDAAMTTATKSKAVSTHVDALDDTFDLQIMRALEGKTTVIPVIAKADTLTAAHMSHLKRSVWSTIQRAKLDPLEALSLDDGEESSASETYDSDMSSSESDILPRQRSPPRKVTENIDADDSDTAGNSSYIIKPTRSSSSAKRTDSVSPGAEELDLPFSILSPDSYALPGSTTRKFPWGEADPNNPNHCDYTRLRECIFSDWRADLRLASREKWYENWRTSRLKRTPQPRTRQLGGVTPLDAVPKEGRSVSPTMAATVRARAASTSRQTSRTFEENFVERPRTMSTASKAERVLGSPRGIAL